MGFLQSTFSLLVGTGAGIYIAQNYDVPNMKKLMWGLMGKAKEFEESYKKPGNSKNKDYSWLKRDARILVASAPGSEEGRKHPQEGGPHLLPPPVYLSRFSPSPRSTQTPRSTRRRRVRNHPSPSSLAPSPHVHHLDHGGVGDDGAAGEGGGPVGAGVLAGLLAGHAEAAGGHGRGRHGGGAELHAATGAGGRDALRHRPRLPPALRHRLRPPLHLHPEELPLDTPRLPLHGDGGGVHGGAAGEAGAAREVRRRRVDPGRHGRHHVPACCARRLPLHPALHHPRRRHDGRQRHDRHRRHHEEAPRGRQDAEEPGGDGAGARGDAEAGDAAAGEEVAGDRTVAGDRQRQDGGAHLAPRRHDGAHHGGRVAAGGHPAADRRDEHAHRRIHRQQHPLHLPLLAGLLLQGLPAPRHRLC